MEKATMRTRGGGEHVYDEYRRIRKNEIDKNGGAGGG
jgi:hypothetical protein